MTSPRIALVEWGVLVGQRPRHAGSNARGGAHGLDVRVPVVRLTTDDGMSGFGACHAAPERLDALLGRSVDDLFDTAVGVREH